MYLTRRETLGLGGSTLAATLIRMPPALGASKIEVVAFDAFPIFDPRPIFAALEATEPEKGKELGALWRTRQFEYTWLRTAADHYEDFWKVTRDALVYAADAREVALSAKQVDTIMDAYLDLKAWPDTRAALDTLRTAGLRLCFLSNFTPHMLQSAIRSAGLDGYFEQVLSTDAVRTFKPDAQAYQLAETPSAFRVSESYSCRSRVGMQPAQSGSATRLFGSTVWACPLKCSGFAPTVRDEISATSPPISN